jgi:FAD/FMN-containing dehydrogenase
MSSAVPSAIAQGPTNSTLKLSGDTRAVLESDAPLLVGLLEAFPTLTILTTSNPHFEEVRKVYNLVQTAQPLAIVRPTSEEDIVATVRFCTDHEISVAIRGGGHDMWGRCLVPGGVVIDMRAINQIKVSSDRTSAQIGGGVLAGDLLSTLEAQGLVTPTGFCSTVGYTGWATGGGYGVVEGAYGLGVDQILSATIITPNGPVVNTDDDSELLWAIRGAGTGPFGVIVQLTIKVYPLPEMLAGLLGFPFSESEKVLTTLQELTGPDLPDAFSGDFMASQMPDVGPVLLILFSWVQKEDDFTEAYKFLDRLTASGTVALNLVNRSKLWYPTSLLYVCHGPQPSDMLIARPPATLSTFVNSLNPLTAVPQKTYFRSRSVEGLSSKFILSISQHPPPDLGCVVIGHYAHGVAVHPDPNSSFPNRKRHIVLGLQEVPGAGWIDPLVESIVENGLALEKGYTSFNGPEESNTVNFFGTETTERLKAIKKRYDGGTIFSQAYPKLL